MKQDAELDQALRCAPEVQVPRHFLQRVMAALPEAPASERTPAWRVPLLAFLASIALIAIVMLALQAGATGWFINPFALWSMLGIETVLAVAWLWRTVVSG